MTDQKTLFPPGAEGTDPADALLKWLSAEQAQGRYYSKRDLGNLTLSEKRKAECPPLSRSNIVRMADELLNRNRVRMVDPVYCKLLVEGDAIIMTDRGFSEYGQKA